VLKQADTKPHSHRKPRKPNPVRRFTALVGGLPARIKTARAAKEESECAADTAAWDAYMEIVAEAPETPTLAPAERRELAVQLYRQNISDARYLQVVEHMNYGLITEAEGEQKIITLDVTDRARKRIGQETY
jgi:hypothetical protein